MDLRQICSYLWQKKAKKSKDNNNSTTHVDTYPVHVIMWQSWIEIFHVCDVGTFTVVIKG